MCSIEDHGAEWLWLLAHGSVQYTVIHVWAYRLEKYSQNNFTGISTETSHAFSVRDCFSTLSSSSNLWSLKTWVESGSFAISFNSSSLIPLPTPTPKTVMLSFRACISKEQRGKGWKLFPRCLNGSFAKLRYAMQLLLQSADRLTTQYLYYYVRQTPWFEL